MFFLPCDVSVCVANHLLLWHWVCPWAMGDSVQVGSRSQWESVQGEAFSAHSRPAHIFFYPQHTQNASLPATHLPHPQGTWLQSCICWGSIRVRTMNSGFNNCERQMRFCVFSYYIYVSWFTLIILNFICNIILYSTVSFCCAAEWISYIYTLFF